MNGTHSLGGFISTLNVGVRIVTSISILNVMGYKMAFFRQRSIMLGRNSNVNGCNLHDLGLLSASSIPLGHGINCLID